MPAISHSMPLTGRRRRSRLSYDFNLRANTLHSCIPALFFPVKYL